MQILCEKDTLEIIVYEHAIWSSTREFCNPEWACIEIKCDPAFKPVMVKSLGDPEPVVKNGVDGFVYKNADVSFEPILGAQ